MADVDPANIPLPEDEPQQPLQRDTKLPPFWTSRPRAWFTYVESRFRLRRITDDQQMFHHVLPALPAEMVSQVLDVVEALPAAIAEHQLSCPATLQASKSSSLQL